VAEKTLKGVKIHSLVECMNSEGVPQTMNTDSTYDPFIIEMPSDSMSFNGTLEFIGRTYHLKGKRIE
jgi:hypothetical protein